MKTNTLQIHTAQSLHSDFTASDAVKHFAYEWAKEQARTFALGVLPSAFHFQVSFSMRLVWSDGKATREVVQPMTQHRDSAEGSTKCGAFDISAVLTDHGDHVEFWFCIEHETESDVVLFSASDAVQKLTR